jgi:hypothetical protein
MTDEALPNPDHHLALPCASACACRSGVYLIENLALAEPARDRRGSFGFVLLATKYLATAGCPVRPVALVL